MAAPDQIVISGARAHNLKGVDLSLPREALIVITGLSGSGKSSLAFDTIYAEGQRRYVESLSAYARQFLGQMEKPDVDSIEGLSPAISIDQKTTSRNPRSTVGTVTEIYDYLRLLWARVGHPHCHKCGAPIAGQSIEQITDRLMTLPGRTRFMVMAPVVRGRKGEYAKLLDGIRAQGYSRAVIDGDLRRLDEDIELDKKYKHDISVVVDRLVMKEDLRKRLAESVEAATGLAEGMVEVELVDSGDGASPAELGGTLAAQGPGALGRGGEDGSGDGRRLIFSERFACLKCGTSMPELEPRIFSFNSPHGCCERCHGLGFQRVVDPELVIPDPTLSISEGALQPFMRSASRYHQRLFEAVAESRGIDLDTPWQDLRKRDRDVILNGTGDERHDVTYRNRYGRRRYYTVRFGGILAELERRYRNTDSDKTRERIESCMALQPCPACEGARLRPESLAVTVGGLNIHQFTQLSARAGLEWIEALELTDTERTIARLIVREIAERLRFLDSVGIGYLSLERAATTLSGGEAQRIRLATQIGSSLVGVLYILDEPSIGLHQRDNAKLIATLARLRDLGNTVIVVEHDEGTIRSADHVVDLGPGAGEHGGHVVSEGPPKAIAADSSSLTGQYLAGKREIPVPDERRVPNGDRGSRRSSTRSSTAPSPTACIAPGCARARTTASRASIRSTRSSTSTSRRSGARRGRIRPPTRESSTTSASCSRRRASHGRAATPRGVSASTSRAGAARCAAGTARSRSRCTSCQTSMCRASSATGVATTARRSRFASRASRSPTCSTCRSRRRSSSSRTSRRSTAASRRCTMSASTTSVSVSRRRRCRAARRSASSSQPSFRRSRPATRSTSSTSRRPGCTSPTCSAFSRSWAASSTPATPWS